MTASLAAALPLAQGDAFFRDRSETDCVQENDTVCFGWALDNADRWVTPTLEHLVLVGVSVAAGFVIAIGLAIVSHRRRWLMPTFLGLTGVIPPTKVTCSNHEGSPAIKLQRWDGEKWTVFTDWIPAMTELVRPMVEAGKSLEEVQAAKPSAPWDEEWGGGFIDDGEGAEGVAEVLEVHHAQRAGRGAGHEPHRRLQHPRQGAPAADAAVGTLPAPPPAGAGPPRHPQGAIAPGASGARWSARRTAHRSAC